VVFSGGPGEGPFAGASGQARSPFTGESGGEMNATFFCTSLEGVLLLELPLAAFRELRPELSRSFLGDAVRVAVSVSTVGISIRVCLGVDIDSGNSVEEDERRGSSMGGKGRVDISGRGLNEAKELGVEVAR
jgi:hypothetical protein